MKNKKEITAAVITIVAIALFIWGYSFLKGINVLSKDYVIYANYSHVEGLVKSNPVLIHGMRVGLVEKISFNPNNSGSVIVKLLIKNPFPIPKNSVAKIFSTDLMGSKGIDLQLGNSKDYVKQGDTLQSSIEASLAESVNAQVAPLKRKAEDMLSSMDSALISFRTIFNDQTRSDFQNSLHGIRNTVDNMVALTSNADSLMESQKNTIRNILSNAESITANLSANNGEVANILQNFSALSDSLSKVEIPKTFQKLDASLNKFNSLLAQVESGNGTLGKLIYNDSLYIELEKSSRDLNLLLEDVRLNPKKYVKLSLF